MGTPAAGRPVPYAAARAPRAPRPGSPARTASGRPRGPALTAGQVPPMFRGGDVAAGEARVRRALAPRPGPTRAGLRCGRRSGQLAAGGAGKPALRKRAGASHGCPGSPSAQSAALAPDAPRAPSRRGRARPGPASPGARRSRGVPEAPAPPGSGAPLFQTAGLQSRFPF